MNDKIIYYIVLTAPNGKREIWSVEREDDENVFGTILHSDLAPKDCGRSWSDTKINISNGVKDLKKLGSTFDFTKKRPTF